MVVAPRAEQRVRAGHPWIYRSDVKQVDADAGDVVRVVGRRGRALGFGLFSDRSVIALRMVTRVDRPPDSAFWRERLADAVRYREQLAIDATAYRLVHGEGDRLPSLIVDRYAETLVVQTLSQGMDRQLPLICELLADIVRPRGILARNDPKVRGLEGLDQTVDLCYGEVPDVVEVREGPRGPGRKPASSSISGRTARRLYATRRAGDWIASATRAPSRCGWPHPARM